MAQAKPGQGTGRRNIVPKLTASDFEESTACWTPTARREDLYVLGSVGVFPGREGDWAFCVLPTNSLSGVLEVCRHEGGSH